MGLKPDHWIRKMAVEHRMIEPFVDGQVRDGVISYGLSSYGYDIRVADEFKVFQPEITAAKLSDVQCAYVAGVLDAQSQVGYTASGAQDRPTLALVVTSHKRRGISHGFHRRRIVGGFKIFIDDAPQPVKQGLQMKNLRRQGAPQTVTGQGVHNFHLITLLFQGVGNRGRQYRTC